jgi:hypothetical protein
MSRRRRPTWLAHLGRNLPVRWCRLRGGLPAVVMIALAMPSFCGTSAVGQNGVDRTGTLDPAEEARKQQDDQKALNAFLEAYDLEPGQILKRVPPPRPEGVRLWWKQKYPNHGNQPHQFGAMVFRWRDPDQLENWGGTTGDGYSLRQLLRYLETDIYPVEIDGDLKLLDTRVTGDWVFRDGVDDERMVHSLEVIIQRVLRLRISLTFRQVERDVVVARGQYRHSPLKGRAKNQVEIYGKQLVPGGGGAGGGTGKFSEFLKWVGEWIDRPVVSDVETPPKEQITWFYNARSPFTEQMRREDHDEALVLQHLHEQMGLTFTRERRPIRILFIERAK